MLRMWNCVGCVVLAVLSLSIVAVPARGDERYSEQLVLRTLSGGYVQAHFTFKTFVPVNLDLPWVSWNIRSQNDLFPLSMVRLLQDNDIQELHLGMVQGKWRYTEWGLPPRDSPAKTQLSVCFNSFLFAEQNWQRVLSQLSGQFCASLNQIKPHITAKPVHSFQPFVHHRKNLTREQKYVYHAMLPQEAVCTENLTPWTKLLPCKSQKGLADLLVATSLLRTMFFSMSLDFKYSCSDILNCRQTTGIELSQNLLVVFKPPSVRSGKFGWSLSSLFNSPLKSHCPLASSSNIFIETLSDMQLTTPPKSFIEYDPTADLMRSSSELPKSANAVYAHYDVRELVEKLETAPAHQKYVNLAVEYPPVSTSLKTNFGALTRFDDLSVRRNIRGNDLFWSGVTTTITNKLKIPVYVVYFDTIPWYFRFYLHTFNVSLCSLGVRCAQTSSIVPKILYSPGRDRTLPHQLEALFLMPPESQVQIDFEFQRQFLRWTEYPPDSSHGMYLSPASLTFYTNETLANSFQRLVGHFLEQCSLKGVVTEVQKQIDLLSRAAPLRIFTDPILVHMPTPDFSMAFNVICFVSTVISIAFGPFYNITISRALVLNAVDAEEKKQKDMKPKKNLRERIRSICVIM